MKSRTKMFVTGVFLLFGLLSSLSRADSITLRDGHHLQGKFAGGTQGVIAFSVGGATQYYEVSNILVMTFDAEGTEAQPSPGQQPAIIPEPGSLERQKLQDKKGNSSPKVATEKTQKKRPVRLIMAAQRSE
jgi:hypothetical protein